MFVEVLNMQNSYPSKGRNKFFILTGLGLGLFILKFPGSNDTLLLTIIHGTQNLLSSYYNELTFAFILVINIMTLIVKFFKPKKWGTYDFIRKNFYVKDLQVFFRLISLLIIISSQYGSSYWLDILNESSFEVIEMIGGIIIFITIANLVLPLLSEFGLSEFLEVMLDRYIKPIFKVPGSAMVYIVTSFFIGSTMAMYFAGAQYEKGLYSKQETMKICTALTVPSLSTALLYWSLIGDSSYFFKYYGFTFALFYSIGLILVRIPPFSKMDTYKAIPSEPASRTGKLKKAIDKASKKAFATHYSLKNNLVSVASILLSFVPFLITLGTFAILIINYTSILRYLSFPYGLYLKLFRFEDPFLLSQTLLLNSIDLVMPAVILKNLTSVKTQMMMAAITLNQLLYIASFLILLSFHRLTTMKELLIILLQRVLLSVPLAVVWAHILL
jgi:nucleoside recognition membrane protein YjiH